MRKALCALVVAGAVGSGTAFAADAQVGAPPEATSPADSSDAVQPSQPAPNYQPPPPTASAPSPPASSPQASSVAPATPEGQWVSTAQYGWVFMPYAQQYTYVPVQGDPSMYVYYPAFGWRWIGAPWVRGWGPRPYWGPWGRTHFAWYAHPWYRFDHRVAHFDHRVAHFDHRVGRYERHHR